MMKRFLNWCKNKYNQEIDATGLAWFRIVYSLVLFFEVKRIWDFKNLMFEEVPFIHVSDINWDLAFGLWFLSILFLIFGLLTRISALINYIFSIIFIGFIGDFEYHVFYAYMGLNFLIMFIPVSRVWSLDRLILKIRYSNSKFHYSPPVTTSVFSYWVPLFVGVGLVYFDSIFFKLTDPIWLKGLGMWWPASHVCASFIALPEVLNQKWLMLFLGYLTIIFELVFIFLFYFKSFRWIFWSIGMGLHLGILIFFPIPFFALAVVALYILLIPVGFFNIFKKKHANPRVTFYYDGECPLCARTKIILEHFDLFGWIQFKTVQSSYATDAVISKLDLNDLLDDIHAVDNSGRVYKGFNTYRAVFRANVLFWPLYLLVLIPGVSLIGNKIYFLVSRNRITERCTDESCGITFVDLPKKDEEIKLFKALTLNDLKYHVVMYFLLVCIIAQSFMIYAAHPIQEALPTGYKNSVFNGTLNKCYQAVHYLSKGFLGITHHAVFGHYHFAERDDLIKIEFVHQNGQHELLPMTKEDGRPGYYVSGSSWVNWNFRVLNSTVDSTHFVKGIQRYTAFWLKKNFRGPLDGHFMLYHKSMEVPETWEFGVLDRDLKNNQWRLIGTANWKKNQFDCSFEKFD